MKKESFFFDFIMITLIIIFVSSVAVFLGATLNNAGYEDGYCSAIGGERLSGDRACNVDGRVVEIPSP